jgi:tetratricopeptide (TPR) repeat protein
MQLVLTVIVAALAAFGAGRWVLARRESTPAERGSGARAALVQGIQELRAENRRLAEELERRERAGVAPAQAQPNAIGDDEIAAAVARWRAAHPEALVTAEVVRAPQVPAGPFDLATAPIEEIVQALSGATFTHAERQELFQRLREVGRIDEYVAAIEKLAAEDPNNAELQVALGHAYLQKLFEVGNSPEAGPLAMKSDLAFDRALELDPNNWGARFSKAVSLSNWPAFMGRGPEAIDQFETLIEQQEALPERPEFAMSYLFLGNMYQSSGEHKEAIATWRDGLARFPDDDDLRRAIELAESQGAAKRDAQR